MNDQPLPPVMARPINVPGLGINIVPAGILLNLLNGVTQGIGLTLGFVAVRAMGLV
jgi:hypothetical protein